MQRNEGLAKPQEAKDLSHQPAIRTLSSSQSSMRANPAATSRRRSHEEELDVRKRAPHYRDDQRRAMHVVEVRERIRAAAREQ